jgi:hypothetical protein
VVGVGVKSAMSAKGMPVQDCISKMGGVPLHHCTSTWFITCKDEFVNSNIAEFQIGHTQLTQCYIMEYQHISATFRDHNLASFLLQWDFVYCKQNKVS